MSKKNKSHKSQSNTNYMGKSKAKQNTQANDCSNEACNCTNCADDCKDCK